MNNKGRGYGNCEVARLGGKEACVKDVSPRTETGYKADGMGKLAPNSKARSSGPQVKSGVVHQNNVLLPGDASPRSIRKPHPQRRIEPKEWNQAEGPVNDHEASSMKNRVPQENPYGPPI